MAARSKRLAGPQIVAPLVPTVLYTVPAGKTALVKVIFAVNNGAVGTAFDAGINGVALANLFLRGRAVAANGTDKQAIDDDRPCVLHAADTLQVQVTGTQAVTFSVHGAELES